MPLRSTFMGDEDFNSLPTAISKAMTVLFMFVLVIMADIGSGLNNCFPNFWP